MIRDPLERGSSPYELLAAAGITPSSTRDEVLDALFGPMRRGPLAPEVRLAWDELRSIERRLAVDFWLYDVDPGEPAAAEVAAPAAGAEEDR